MEDQDTSVGAAAAKEPPREPQVSCQADDSYELWYIAESLPTATTSMRLLAHEVAASICVVMEIVIVRLKMEKL